MEFNEKCKVMHIWVNIPRHNYHLNNILLEETTKEKDLGVYATTDWKANRMGDVNFQIVSNNR